MYPINFGYIIKLKDMERRDIYDIRPRGMDKYLAEYGWHFSKPMAEYAISRMKDRNGSKVQMKDRKILEDALKSLGADIEKLKGYDIVYVEAMARSDYYGNSITTDAQLHKFVMDYLCDRDGYEGVALTRYYADCLAKGEPIIWEDMI